MSSVISKGQSLEMHCILKITNKMQAAQGGLDMTWYDIRSFSSHSANYNTVQIHASLTSLASCCGIHFNIASWYCYTVWAAWCVYMCSGGIPLACNLKLIDWMLMLWMSRRVCGTSSLAIQWLLCWLNGAHVIILLVWVVNRQTVLSFLHYTICSISK